MRRVIAHRYDGGTNNLTNCEDILLQGTKYASSASYTLKNMLKPLLIIAIVIGGYLYSNRPGAVRNDSKESVSITGPDGRPIQLSNLDPAAQARAKQVIVKLNSSNAAKPEYVMSPQTPPEIFHSSKPVLVDFWAPWCGPCRALTPTIDALASQRSDVVIRKINTDDNPKMTQMFRIRGIPCLILFKNGREVDRLVGAVSKSQIELMIARNQ
jgi:thioredoxin 1